MKTYLIFWREYMNLTNNGNATINADNMIEAIKHWEAKYPIRIICKISDADEIELLKLNTITII